MIRIIKDSYPPEVRFVAANHPKKEFIKWVVAQSKVLHDFATNPVPFQDGTYTFSQDYGREQFRKALEKCQGPKCCFCEKPIHGGAIEHFRPKKAWQQTRGTAFTRPGYYWLAYRWSNMLISCTECNQADQKGNYFPVTGFRAVSPTDNYNAEVKTILNPAEEDPAIDISFSGSLPFHKTPRGQLNIEIFKLDTRGDIISIRKDRFDLYYTLKEIASMLAPSGSYTQHRINEARKFINKAASRKAPFAGMINENKKNVIL